jgi:hypothetical protein
MSLGVKLKGESLREARVTKVQWHPTDISRRMDHPVVNIET